VRERTRPWLNRGAVAVVIWLVLACVSLGVGISNVYHARQISRHGVTANATVIQNHGWGSYVLRVRYQTAAGQQETGTLDTPARAATYPVGSAVTVTYDPYSPSVVTWPGSGDGSGWIEIGAGAFVMLLLAATAARAWLRGRQRRLPWRELAE
jgi:hypothetical protein